MIAACSAPDSLCTICTSVQQLRIFTRLRSAAQRHASLALTWLKEQCSMRGTLLAGLADSCLHMPQSVTGRCMRWQPYISARCAARQCQQRSGSKYRQPLQRRHSWLELRQQVHRRSPAAWRGPYRRCWTAACDCRLRSRTLWAWGRCGGACTRRYRIMQCILVVQRRSEGGVEIHRASTCISSIRHVIDGAGAQSQAPLIP